MDAAFTLVNDGCVLDLNDLADFVRVVDARGFSAAARVLAVPKSRLSQRVARLEETLGARLIQRTPRRFVVTDVGRELHRHASAILAEAEAAESAVRGHVATPRGVVRLTCSISMARELAQILPRFLTRHPEVRLVQHATNRFVDLVGEGFDVGLRGHDAPLADSDLVQRPIARTPWHLFAAPAYLAERGAPSEPQALAGHATLAVPNRAGETAWTLRHARGREVRVALAPRVASDDLETLASAARAALGVAALPGYLCRPDVGAGRLVRVLPGWTTGNAQVTLLLPSRRGRLAAVRALVEFLVAEYPALLSAEPEPAPRVRRRTTRR